MTFDLAYFLTGDAANQAAAEHGDETPVPNDYYIVNDNPLLRTTPISPSVEIDAIDWSRVDRASDRGATRHRVGLVDHDRGRADREDRRAVHALTCANPEPRS
jgi:hypothetical protein